MSLINKVLTFSKYGVISLIEKAFNYFTVIALTYFISPEEVGLISYFLAIYSFVFPLINMSTNGYLLVQWQLDNKNFGSYFFSSMQLNGLVTALLILTGFIFVSLFGNQSGFPIWVLLGLPLMGFLDSIKGNFLSYAIIKNKFWQYAVITISYTAILFVSTFLLVKYYKAEYISRVVSTYATVIIVLLIVLYFIKKESFIGKIKKVFITDSFKYGILLIPHAIGLIVLDLSDRFFINKYSGEYELGIYSIAYSLASLLSLVSSSFFTAWVPKLNSYLFDNTDDSKQKIVKTHLRYILAMMIFAILVFIFAYISLSYVLDVKYSVALKYLPFLIATYFFQGVYLCFAGIIFYFKKNIFFMWASLMNITINTTLNYLLIPAFGAMGAAVSTLLSMFVFSAIIAYFSNRIYPLPWHKNIKTN